MRCSYSEGADTALDEYLDGTLSPVRHARLCEHLRSCESCAALLAELRVVDALLLQPRRIEVPPNFNGQIMAEVRAIPAPHVPRSRPFAVLATYVVFAWVAIGTFLAFGGSSARAALAFLAAFATRFASEGQGLAAASGRLFGARSLDVTTAMGALLAIDLACASAFVGAAMLHARRTSSMGEPW